MTEGGEGGSRGARDRTGKWRSHWCRGSANVPAPQRRGFVACDAQLQGAGLPPLWPLAPPLASTQMESRAAIGGNVRRKGGRGSLLLGAPEPRGDGAERESLLLLLGELGQTLLLLLADKTNGSNQRKSTQIKVRVRLISPPNLRQLSLSAFEGLDGVVLQSVVLQHRTDIVHSAQSDG